MADILIRGMDIPRDGRKHTAVIQFLEDGKCRAIVEYSKSYDDRSVKVFEAVPLPEGHGRLIDADALLNNNVVGTQIAGWGKMFHETAIAYAPTIVPAEGGTDNGF